MAFPRELLKIRIAKRWTPASFRNYALVFLSASLAATVRLKAGEIQYLELIFVADLFLLLAIFLLSDMRLRVFRPFFGLGINYCIFLALAFLFSLAALDQQFAPWNFTFLKRPVLITIARILELFIDVFYMIYLASLYREDEALCGFGARVYFWAGVLSSIYAIISYPVYKVFGWEWGIDLGSNRMRGFYNEGGPYGLYILSVCVLGGAMYRKRWLTRSQFYWCEALLLISMVGSESKSAFFALATIGVLHLTWSVRGVRRWIAVGTICVLFVLLGAAVNIGEKVALYARGSAMYQKVSQQHWDDGNFVMGRVAGSVLAPRMIAARPWLGIGWGNYSLVRDDPAYRQGTAFSIGKIDAPSLGPIDYIAELGFPLWIYMTWLAFKPVYLLRRHRADPWLLTLAVIQPVTNWFGAHLNMTYPWIIVGIALGMGFGQLRPPAPAIASHPESVAV